MRIIDTYERVGTHGSPSPRPVSPIFTGVLPEFDSIDKTNPNCVVIGDAAENFSYQNLNEAFRVLVGLEKPVLFSMGQG